MKEQTEDFWASEFNLPKWNSDKWLKSNSINSRPERFQCYIINTNVILATKLWPFAVLLVLEIDLFFRKWRKWSWNSPCNLVCHFSFFTRGQIPKITSNYISWLQINKRNKISSFTSVFLCVCICVCMCVCVCVCVWMRLCVWFFHQQWVEKNICKRL